MNTVIEIGRLTATPELKATPNGKYVCNFSLAVERKFKDAEGKPIVDYIDFVAWNSQAEFLCKWFDKGVRVAVKGELQTRTYPDNEGKNRKVYEVKVDEVEFADGKRDANTVATTPTNTFDTTPNTTTPVANTNDNTNPFSADGFAPVGNDSVDLPF